MKGLVVDVKDSRAVILKDDGTFVDVKNKNYKIGQKVKRSSAVMRSIKIAACIALCVITSAVSYKFYYTPYSYLYIDINPSVRLDLNYFDVVINCMPLNDDAKFIEISSGNVEDSINEVITKCEEKGFLNEKNNEIEINVYSDSNSIKGSVSKVYEKYQQTNFNVVVKNTTREESERANKKGISVKYQRVLDSEENSTGKVKTEDTGKAVEESPKDKPVVTEVAKDTDNVSSENVVSTPNKNKATTTSDTKKTQQNTDSIKQEATSNPNVEKIETRPVEADKNEENVPKQVKVTTEKEPAKPGDKDIDNGEKPVKNDNNANPPINDTEQPEHNKEIEPPRHETDEESAEPPKAEQPEHNKEVEPPRHETDEESAEPPKAEQPEHNREVEPPRHETDEESAEPPKAEQPEPPKENGDIGNKESADKPPQGGEINGNDSSKPSHGSGESNDRKPQTRPNTPAKSEQKGPKF